jgi:hypothetical protein
MGFLGAIGLLVFLAWLLLMRANKEAAAAFLRGFALLLTYKKPPVVIPNGKVEEKESMGFKLKRKTQE